MYCCLVELILNVLNYKIEMKEGVFYFSTISDMCADVMCQNGGTCTIKDGKAFCECADSYSGNNCEKSTYSFKFFLLVLIW